jgi:hypothetical protein
LFVAWVLLGGVDSKSIYLGGGWVVVGWRLYLHPPFLVASTTPAKLMEFSNGLVDSVGVA